MSTDDPRSAQRRPINERLAEHPPREDTRGVPTPMLRDSATVRVERADERAALIVGALVLQRAADMGQTKVFSRSVQALLDRATEGLSPRQFMQLEIEAHKVLEWLVGEDPNPKNIEDVAHRRDNGLVVYDPDASVPELIQRAVDEQFDLKIDYFSRSRGEMNTRRITPIALEAEVYVQAFCHSRRAERVFRLNRITRCIPIQGRPVQPTQREALAESTDDREPIQISLLED